MLGEEFTRKKRAPRYPRKSIREERASRYPRKNIREERIKERRKQNSEEEKKKNEKLRTVCELRAKNDKNNMIMYLFLFISIPIFTLIMWIITNFAVWYWSLLTLIGVILLSGILFYVIGINRTRNNFEKFADPKKGICSEEQSKRYLEDLEKLRIFSREKKTKK